LPGLECYEFLRGSLPVRHDERVNPVSLRSSDPENLRRWLADGKFARAVRSRDRVAR